MVRFIIVYMSKEKKDYTLFTFQYGQIYYKDLFYKSIKDENIYIPIWLDLLCVSYYFVYDIRNNLHSNMVRFIMKTTKSKWIVRTSIYIPIWLDLLSFAVLVNFVQSFNLHSNMVRFIICIRFNNFIIIIIFTFQYGQIYYYLDKQLLIEGAIIYIPIWLDLLLYLRYN